MKIFWILLASPRVLTPATKQNKYKCKLLFFAKNSFAKTIVLAKKKLNVGKWTCHDTTRPRQGMTCLVSEYVSSLKNSFDTVTVNKIGLTKLEQLPSNAVVRTVLPYSETKNKQNCL